MRTNYSQQQINQHYLISRALAKMHLSPQRYLSYSQRVSDKHFLELHFESWVLKSEMHCQGDRSCQPLRSCVYSYCEQRKHLCHLYLLQTHQAPVLQHCDYLKIEIVSPRRPTYSDALSDFEQVLLSVRAGSLLKQQKGPLFADFIFVVPSSLLVTRKLDLAEKTLEQILQWKISSMGYLLSTNHLQQLQAKEATPTQQKDPFPQASLIQPLHLMAVLDSDQQTMGQVAANFETAYSDLSPQKHHSFKMYFEKRDYSHLFLPRKMEGCNQQKQFMIMVVHFLSYAPLGLEQMMVQN